MTALRDMRGYYNRLASQYDDLRFRKAYHRQIDAIERQFVISRIRPGAKVLEVGCGTGRFTTELVKVASSVTAVDVSPEMLTMVREKAGGAPNLRLVEGDLYQLERTIGAEKYDVVVSMRVLPHLIDKHGALSTLNRVLRPGGTALFDLWNRKSFIGIGRVLLRRPTQVPIYFVDYRKMLYLVEETGFQVLSSLAWGYPRVGTRSLDGIGNRLLKRFAYSVVFHVKQA